MFIVFKKVFFVEFFIIIIVIFLNEFLVCVRVLLSFLYMYLFFFGILELNLGF